MNSSTKSASDSNPSIAVIGGGPAGLMAAETAVRHGIHVEVYDGMASMGRKFLLAGKGGLNLTHSEPLEPFMSRYGKRRAELEPLLNAFGPDQIKTWARQLGIDTFVGSSGRVFPLDKKSAPLLRAWLRYLREAGVIFHARHRWQGWDGDGLLRFDTPAGLRLIQADAVVLALGGGSWSKLGSDGTWVPWLAGRGIQVKPLRPANCGFDCKWSEHLKSRFAGQPVKSVTASFTDAEGEEHERTGEFIITENGVEGNLIYALSAALRDTIDALGVATLRLDLAPGRHLKSLIANLAKPKGSASMAKHLQKRAGIGGAKASLLWEVLETDVSNDAVWLAKTIKSFPLRLTAPRPIDEAISSAGGVAWEALDKHLMIRVLPGVFCAGEMLDWEAPTGGYLLSACFATGKAAGEGAAIWLT